MVVVTAGIFQGYEAIFDSSLQGIERVRVLLKMLGEGRMALELDREQIGRGM